jgi:hypothetical protein
MVPKATLTILHSITILKVTLTEVLVALLVLLEDLGVPINSIMVLVGQGDRTSLTTVHLAALVVLVVQAALLAGQTNSTMVLLQTILSKEELAGLTGKHYVLLAGLEL